jgi:glucosylceramidase
MYLQVDLGSAKMVSGVTIDVGGDTGDIANGWDVSLSTDGTTFTSVASCTAPAQAQLIVNFTATNARYVRYTCKGAPGAANATLTAWMSIAEVDIACN